jgi:hypothetical protein
MFKQPKHSAKRYRIVTLIGNAYRAYRATINDMKTWNWTPRARFIGGLIESALFIGACYVLMGLIYALG